MDKSTHRSLDARIADALNGEIVQSSALSDLIIEIEDALPISTKALEAEKVRLVDPSNRDYEKTKQMVDRIELELQRLEAAIPMLEQRYAKAQHHERKQALLPEFNEVVEDYNQTSVALTTTYLEFCAKFVPMLNAAVELNSRIRKMNARANGLGLSTIPLIAEGLLEGLALPSPNGVFWPDPRKANALTAQFAEQLGQVYSSPLRQMAYGPDWWAARQIQDQAKIEEWNKRNALQEEQRQEARREFERSKVKQR